MKFKPGNKILYSQDFNYYRGVPSDVEFTVERLDENSALLSAPGYGGKPYGNGKIRVSRSQRMAKIYERLFLEEKGHLNY